MNCFPSSHSNDDGDTKGEIAFSGTMFYTSPLTYLSNFDVLPSSLLDPSWVQVNQTMKLFGTRGMLSVFNIKSGRGAC